MKENQLGELQEVVLLTILLLKDNAYGVTIKREIKEQVNRSISRGALHTTLSRLEDKNLVRSWQGETDAKRGGMRKRYYEVTSRGISVLQEVKANRDRYWDQIPSLSLR